MLTVSLSAVGVGLLAVLEVTVMHHDVLGCGWSNPTGWLFSLHKGGVFVCDWLLSLHRAMCFVFLSSLAADRFLLVWYALICSVCVCANSPSSMLDLRLYYNNAVDRVVLPFSNSLENYTRMQSHVHSISLVISGEMNMSCMVLWVVCPYGRMLVHKFSEDTVCKDTFA